MYFFTFFFKVWIYFSTFSATIFNKKLDKLFSNKHFNISSRVFFLLLSLSFCMYFLYYIQFLFIFQILDCKLYLSTIKYGILSPKIIEVAIYNIFLMIFLEMVADLHMAPTFPTKLSLSLSLSLSKNSTI